MPIGGFIDSVFGGNERAKAKRKSVKMLEIIINIIKVFGGATKNV